MTQDKQDIIQRIRKGEIGVIPTDTLYGVVGSARNPDAVESIYRLKNRQADKPLIVLIADVGDLASFGVKVDHTTRRVCESYWPGPVSIVLPCSEERYAYLHRGSGSIAFRMPRPAWLHSFLRETGPLVAPSANPEGCLPAETIDQAREYFGAGASFYLDGGTRSGNPSALIRVVGGREERLR